ncbi:MAG: hypothetical protein KDK06_20595 [Gammaproteobacteria bacterium]|nr:hypothetical protein [Gammaproteobacteria bacterium]
MTRYLLAACLFGATLAGCSGSEPPESAFKGQTEAITKAEDANRAIEEAAAVQRQAIDEQGR